MAPAAMAANTAVDSPVPDLRHKATMTEVMATMEPTDRSMPPRTMTRVIPSAAVPTMAVCLAMVSSVRTDAKLSGPTRAKKTVHRREADERAETGQPGSNAGRRRRHETAWPMMVSSSSSATGRASDRKPRLITAMRSASPSSSGR